MPPLELLHDWDSFQSFKVRLCLFEKQATWQSRIVSLARFENLAAPYLALNPLGVVPTLLVGDQIIVESSIINEYINDLMAADDLLQAEPIARAKVRMWARYEDDIVHPAVRLATFNLMIKQRVRTMPTDAFEALIATHPWPARAAAYRRAATADIDSAQVNEAIAAFKKIIAKMEAALGQTTWLVGDAYSLADIAMTPFINRLERLDMLSLCRTAPRLQDWIGRVRARSNFAQAVAPADKRMPAPDANVVARYLAQASA